MNKIVICIYLPFPGESPCHFTWRTFLSLSSSS